MIGRLLMFARCYRLYVLWRDALETFCHRTGHRLWIPTSNYRIYDGRIARRCLCGMSWVQTCIRWRKRT
jgi:hypothetical protein